MILQRSTLKDEMQAYSQSKDNTLVFSPELTQDTETSNWSLFKAYENGAMQDFATESTQKRLNHIDQQQTSSIVERLNGIIDTEDPKFDKIKRENFEKMEKNLDATCTQMFDQTNSFYECQNALSQSIQHAIATQREELAPELDDSEKSEQLHTLATSSWLFQTLPGTNAPSNPESLASLNQKLAELQPLALWNEPVEIANGGPEFFAKLKSELLTKKDQNYDSTILHSEQITALFAIAVLSGNQELLLETLDTLSQFAKEQPQASEAAFERSKTKLAAYVTQIQTFSESQPYQHALLKQNISRVFGIGSLFPTQGLNERNTSITCDGVYIYLAIGVPKRAQLYKIGSGQGGSTPGKVYLQAALDREGEITWAFCQGKLYLRRSSDEFGSLQIYDPQTLTKTGTAKLFLADMPQLLEPTVEQANRNYPLLVDPSDNTICIVTVQSIKRERSVKSDFNAQIEKLVTKKAEDTKIRNSAPAQETEEDLRKLPKNEQLKRQKEKIKKKLDPPGPAFSENPANVVVPDISTFSILAFELHKFDLSGNYKGKQKDSNTTDHFSSLKEAELMKDELVTEMYYAFSGLFKITDCARALKYNKNDIEAAANWLVAEKEQPDTNLQFRRISTTLLSESLSNDRRQGELDPMLPRASATLMINSVTCGRWTLNEGKLSYHQTTQSDQGSIHTFSIDPNKKREQKIQNQPQIVIIDNDQKILADRAALIQQIRESDSEQNRNQQRKTQAMYVHMAMITGGGMPQYIWDSNQWRIMQPNNIQQALENVDPQNFVTEEDMYEPIKLYGTHESSLTKQKALDQNFTTYITYCSQDNRYYGLPLGNSQRLIFSAGDLQHLNETKQFQLTYSSLDEFVNEVLKFLVQAEKYRWRMPWRWSCWSHTFRTSLNQLIYSTQNGHAFAVQSDSLSPKSKLSEDSKAKKKIKKLKKKLELVERLEIVQTLQKHNLQTSHEPSKPTLKHNKQKQQPKVNQQPQQFKPPPSVTQSSGLNSIPHWARAERDFQEFREQRDLRDPFEPPSESSGFRIPDSFLSQAQLKPLPKVGNEYKNLEEIVFRDKQMQQKQEQMNKLQQLTFQSLVNSDGYPMKPGTNGLLYCGRNLGVQAIPGSDGRCGPNNGPQCSSCQRFQQQNAPFIPNSSAFSKQSLFGIPTFSPAEQKRQINQIQENFVLPKQQICVPQEISKHYAYCQTGSLRSLRSLLQLYKRTQDLQVLKSILVWSVNASNLSVYNGQKDLDELLDICLSVLREKQETKCGVVGRILIIGWWLFAADVQRQLQVLISLLNHTKDITLQQSQQVSCADLLDPDSDKSIVQLLAARFCQHASFFDLEILNLRKVYPSVLLVKSQQQVEQSVPFKKQLNEAKNESNQVLIDLKPRFMHHKSQQTDFFSSFIKSDISITDIHIENIQFRKITTKRRGNSIFNPLEFQSTNQSTLINQQYFSVPLAACLVQDLMDPFQDPKYVTFQNVVKMYQSDDMEKVEQQTRQEQLKLLQSNIANFKTLQQQLIQIFKSRILQGCNYSTELFAYLLGHALEVSSLENPIDSQLLIEAIDIAISCPKSQILHQIQVALSKEVSKKYTQPAAHLAYACLPKLYTLISNFTKSTQIVLDKEFSEGLDVASQKVWETAHPYAKQDDRKSHIVKVQGAIGYSIEFDKRCSTESPGDVLLLRSSDYNYQVSECIGTEFKFERRPHHSQIYVLLGEQLQIEFRHMNPRSRNQRNIGRGRGGPSLSSIQSREEITRRWGYKLTIKPIFGMSKFSENKISQVFVQNNIIQMTHMLALTLTQANQSEGQQLFGNEFGITESQAVIKKTLGWHLFKGGLKLSELENQSNAETIIDQSLQSLKRSQNNYQSEIQKFFESELSDLNAYYDRKYANKKTENQTMGNTQFEPEEKSWHSDVKAIMEQQEVLSNIVRKLRIQVPYPLPIQQQMMKKSFLVHKDKWDKVEQVLIVAMLYHSGSIADFHKYNELSKETISRGQSADLDEATAHLMEEFQLIGKHINLVLNWMLARLQGQNEFQMIIEDTISVAQTIITERLQQKQREEEVMKQQALERQLMAEAEQEMRNFVISEAESLKLKQTISSSSSGAQPPKKAEVTKLKQKPSKKRSNIIKISDSVAKLTKKKSKAKEESKHEQEKPVKQEDIKLTEQPQPDKPKYCELSQTEIANLKVKILTKAHQDFIDNYQIDGDLSKLLNICMFFDINLNVNDTQESLKQVFKRVKQKIQPLIDFDNPQDNQLLAQLDLKDLKLGTPAEEVAQDVLNRVLLLLEVQPSISYQSEVTRIVSTKSKMSTIFEQDEDIQSQLSGGFQQAIIPQIDSELEDLDDLPPLQPKRVMSLPATIQSGIARLGATTQPPSVTRARKQSAEYAVFIDSYRKWRIWSKRAQDEEEDLSNPNGNPLFGIVSFAKQSQIYDPEILRSRMKSHVYRAAFRLVGLQYQEKLFGLLQNGPFVRFMWGAKAFSLHKSVLDDIETCGESLTRQLNAVSRQIVQQLMQSVVAQYKIIGQKLTQLQSQKQRKINGKIVEHSITNGNNQQPLSILDQKRLLLTLNDIRVLLSNIYTKEYVLESLRVDKQISSKNTLGVDQILVFLQSVVSILVRSQSAQVGLNVFISQVSKLVLDCFIHQSNTVKTETQRILLDMLLETVVNQLTLADSNDKMQLLQLLSEVVRISIRSDSETSVLQPGSAKVTNCIKLLTKFICNPSEVPAVVRQAIRCAKLLLKQLTTQDKTFDSLICKDVLKALGNKIMSYKNPEKSKSDEQTFQKQSLEVPIEQKQIDTTNSNQVTNSSKVAAEQLEYYVYAHLNIPHEEDFTFLVTALFYWERRNPIYSQNLYKNAAEIVKKVDPPKPAASITSEPLPPISISNKLPSIDEVEKLVAKQVLEDLKQEDRKENQNDDEKDWQSDSSNSDEESMHSQLVAQLKKDKAEVASEDNNLNVLLVNEESQDAIKEVQKVEKVEKVPKVQQNEVDYLQQRMHFMMQKMHQDSEQIMEADIQNEIFARRHQEISMLLMEGSPDMEKEAQVMKMMAELEAHQALKEQQMASRRGPRPTTAPNKNGGIPNNSTKLAYVQLAIDEIIKQWKAPLSTDSESDQERAFKEINFLKSLQLVVKEALEYVNQFQHQRNSLVLTKRPLSLEKSTEFAELLKLSYIGQVDPVPLNPYSKSENTQRKIACINLTQAELFPLLPKKVQDLGKQDQSKSPVQPVQISVAPKRFKVNIIEKNVAAALEKEMTTKLQDIKASQKSQRMGPIVHCKQKKQKFGFSISIIIGELILFLRSLPNTVLTTMFNKSLKAYLADTDSKALLYGILATFGGWNNQISTGTDVEVNTNDQWCRGTVIEPGFGKRFAIVALEDDVLNLQKIPHAQIRAYSGELAFYPDYKLLTLSVIKAQNDQFLLSLLLRACTKMQWQLDISDPDYKNFLQIITDTSKNGQNFEEDKSKKEYESSLTLTWERLIDLYEQKHQLIFTPKDKEENEIKEIKLENIKQTGIMNQEYAQMKNSYLSGLPEATTQQSKSEANLKLLYYWEKNIIPQILAFCQGTYRPYEFEYYFEQVRYHLRRGDSGSAINDAMTMLENKIPPGMIIPDENQDWTSKILEECIVGTWLLAKIKHKNSGSDTESSASKLFLNKLKNIGVEEILVQIKVVDGRSNAVLAEYVGLDQMQSHYLWIPVANLKSLQSPMPSQSLASAETLNKQLSRYLSRVSQIYCREILTNLVEKQKSIPNNELKIDELISWSIWQNFTNDALCGWMKNFSSVIPIFEEVKSEDQIHGSKNQISLNKILNKRIEEFSKENSTILHESQSKNTTNMLTVLSEMMQQSENQRNLIDWCATLWYSMANSVAQNRCVVDICNEYEKYLKLNAKNQLLPLHELLPNLGDQSVGTLLMFKKNGVKLAPCSKVQFFSDPEMVNLIHELNAGSEVKKEVPPIVLQYSHIWVYHDAGTNALLSKEEQHIQLGDNVSSSLQTAIINIPKEWQIACWLTETLSTSVINQKSSSFEYIRDVFQKLITSLVAFYDDSKAPNVFKSEVLKLLSRLLVKFRHVYKSKGGHQVAAQSHFDKMFIPKDFFRNLFSELMIQMESEDCLHCAFVQDSVEFIMSFVIPVEKLDQIKHSQLLEDIEVPKWLTPILHLSYFLHFLRGEIDFLPSDTLSQSNQINDLESLIIISVKNLPLNYSIEWVQEKVRELILSHQGRVLNLTTDFIVQKDYIIVLLDGWHPLKPLEIKEELDSEIEEKKEEIKPQAVELKPTVFACQVCTFENALAAPACDMCGTPRPPMEIIMEAFRKANAPPEEPKTQAKLLNQATSLNAQRVASLAADIRKIISRDQKQKLISKMSVQDEENKEDSKQPDEEEDHKSDNDDSEEDIDIQNLPGDPEERFRILGLDQSLLDTGDQDLIMVMEMSKIQEIQDHQNQKAQAKAKKESEKLALKKQKEKELERKRLQESGSSVYKLDVTFGENIFSSQQVSPLAMEFLMNRVRDSNTDQFQLNARTKAVIAQIHDNWQKFTDLSLPIGDSLLDDLEISAEKLKNSDLDSLQEKFLNLALADIRLFFKVLRSQGYDVWLTQAELPSQPTEQQMKLVKNVNLLEKVKRLVEQDMCQEQKIVTNLEPNQLRGIYLLGSDFKWSQSIGYQDETQISHVYPELCENVTQPEIRYMWSLLKKFNEFYAPVVPFINQTDTRSHQNDTSVLPMTMAAYMNQTRDLCFKCVKTDLRHLILEKTTVPRDQAPKLYFERLKLAEGAADGVNTEIEPKSKLKEKQNEHMFMFTQAHNQIKEMDIGLLRPKKPQGAEPHIAFEIIFKNEHVVGEGGPYRQFFADVSKELQPSRLERGTQQQLLDLLAPCANQRESEKVGKDRFVIQSQSVSQQQLSQYEFLGILMGICIRTGANLILDLPQFFWKQLVGQKLTLDDLYEIEIKLVNNLKQMLQQSEDEFNSNDVFWTSQLSDGTQIELRPKGNQTKVKYQEVADFVAEILTARLKESQAQYNAIRRGIAKVIPPSLFNIVTAKELEIWVCGRNSVDIDLLRRHTKYQGGSDAYSDQHQVIKNFWQFLASLREDERQKFIKFCWGQERLPANDEAFINQNVRFMIKPAPKQDKRKQNLDQDQLLPKADTCFFNFELPAYSSLEVMRAKIIQAITLDCVSMNAEEDQQNRDQNNDMHNGRGAREMREVEHEDGLFDDDY